MSKLLELIQELCPDGVEYKTLGEIGKVSMCKRIMKSETSSSGDVPFFKIGTFGREPDAFISQEKYAEYRNTYSFPNKGDILISAAGTIGRTVVYDGKPAYYQDSNIVWLAHDENVVLNTFLLYCYQLKPWVASTGGTIARLYNDNISKAIIPVPPLLVQAEIVRILDNFTELTAELIAELTAELTARKMQYEYYLESIIVNCKNAHKMKLNEICQVYDGTHQTPKYTNSGIKFVSVENINNLYGSTKYISEEAFDKYKIKPQINDIFMTRITAGIIGKCTIVDQDEPLAYYVSLALLRPNSEVIDSKYLKYYIESGYGKKELRKYILTDATPPKINKDAIGKVSILVPSIVEQLRAVALLEHFDTLCNDLSKGLRAEIEARQKQYKHYRDKLLTFKQLS